MKLLALIVLFGVSLVPATAQQKARKSAPPSPGLAELRKMAARFAPTPLRVDLSSLSAGDRQALAKLIAAGRLMKPVFLQQYWSGNPALYARLQKDTTPLGKARLENFRIHTGPWSAVDDFKPFLPGVPAEKPKGSNFYPEDMTREEFESWLASLSPEQQEQARSFFTVIRWKNGTRSASGGGLLALPYSEEYQENLTPAADLLKEAAGLTQNASLKNFLSLRADAFLSNQYYASDLAWMDLDAPLEITIGPYETYNDQLFGYKAAFEVFVNLRDDDETAKFSILSAHLQPIEDNLPLDPQSRNPKLGQAAPIRVVDEIFAVDSNPAIATAAYNLPNDERIVQDRGSKRVMLRNVQEAKFRSALLPIARRVLSPATVIDVNFDSFFNQIVAHELMHGLGPHRITVDGRDTTVRKELKELYSAIEEAKADVTGLFALQYMMNHAKEMKLSSVLPSDEAAERQLYTTYLASMFRSMRFGLNDAHGKGMAIQFNTFMDRGAVAQRADSSFTLDLEKFKQAVRDLDHDLLTLEAQGDYAGAKTLLDDMGVVRPPLQKVFDRLAGVPTDIQPIFVTADELVPERPVSQVKPAPNRSRRHAHR
jgi:hypothetical protein